MILSILLGLFSASQVDAAPDSNCVDTIGWTNKGLHGHKEYVCDDYRTRGWCANGDFAPGQEWTGAIGVNHPNCAAQSTKGDCAAVYNYPGQNCCVCGKSYAKYDLRAGATCAEGYKPLTSSWQDCEEAARSMGFVGDPVNFVEYDYPWGTKRPQGCFRSDVNNRFHFNRGAGGDFKGNDRILCIRKGEPTAEPTVLPTDMPTSIPTVSPTPKPSAQPTMEPSAQPTVEPTTCDWLYDRVTELAKEVAELRLENRALKTRLATPIAQTCECDSGATKAPEGTNPGTNAGTITYPAKGPITTLVDVKINFQPDDMAVPSGYIPDSGHAFGNRGHGFTYGWACDFTGGARDRFATGTRDSSLVIFDRYKNCGNDEWEIELPNGNYVVEVGFSDIQFGVQTGGCKIEGQSVSVGFVEKTDAPQVVKLYAPVTDGRLTLSGSWTTQDDPNGCGKVSFMHIKTMSRGCPVYATAKDCKKKSKKNGLKCVWNKNKKLCTKKTKIKKNKDE